MEQEVHPSYRSRIVHLIQEHKGVFKLIALLIVVCIVLLIVINSQTRTPLEDLQAINRVSDLTSRTVEERFDVLSAAGSSVPVTADPSAPDMSGATLEALSRF